MANEVYANGREIACKAGSGKVIAAFPDVCFTPPDKVPPTPPGVPVPYPLTSTASDTDKGSKEVVISNKEVMKRDSSNFKKCNGDNAAQTAKKGLINSKLTGKVQFVSWSMDVKIEDKNVVRHIDVTTSNHASPQANAPAPWPYMDAVAFDVSNHPCKKMASSIKSNCSSGSDYSGACCDARKCFLMPKTPNKCCSGSDGKQMTGHHLLPSKEFVAHASRSKKDVATNYESNKAPCLCVEGHSHSKRTEHGQVGCNYTVEKNNWMKNNPGKTYTLAVGCEVGARSAVGKANVPAGSSGCDEDCLTAQLSEGHSAMDLKVASNDPLPRSKQPSPPKIKFD